MTRKKIIIPYFPKALRFSSPLLFLVGAYLVVLDYPVWGILLALLPFVVLSMNYVTEIDMEAKRYTDYLSVLGIATNKESKRFNRVDRIVVTKGNYSQTINTRVQSRQLDWSDYTATLIVDNGTLDLLTRNDKKELLIALKDFTDFLATSVEDRTTSQHYWVDMDKIQA